jgi:predicted phosphodiesterase
MANMKIALISDIHGNSIALDAVLSDVRFAGGVDEYWIVGDHVAIGPDPNGVLERLTSLPEVSFTRGNTDRLSRQQCTLCPSTG